MGEGEKGISLRHGALVKMCKLEFVGEPQKLCGRLCSVTQSCLTLCDPIDCSPPGSSVRGISQARMLEWVAVPYPSPIY